VAPSTSTTTSAAEQPAAHPVAGRSHRHGPWAGRLALLLGLYPVFRIIADGVIDRYGLTAIPLLGSNPIAEILNRLGLWALILLMATLACRPLTAISKLTFPMRIRRTLGLLSFSYGTLHLLVYVGLDQVLDWKTILEDLVKRKFITIGFLALMLMVPLAATSTKKMVRRLGGASWRRLHYLIYPAALCGVIHFVWRVKKDLTEPLIFGGTLGLLLAVRVVLWLRGRKRRASAGAGASAPAGP
jgi:sulfoxide reductase heme-binding subunit YedZ